MSDVEFYRELLAAAPEEAEGVLRRWWCEAMLDTDPPATGSPRPRSTARSRRLRSRT
ncbi:hypothetical protein [Streptomyces goshikiensis]|uniref:hypothetical protein n=1 Tax=Streptomyces goshikiensis TaxID=1942 RepID=UPI0022F3AE35|nr:hypothetical protein [Streptomyces goshikiensis]WBY25135.1 hypothetical protein PET44_36135 [Streptomyces goshikiensis]